ncbi:hypothetical protein BKA93DRAFT_714925, partial [Sparassis latifolia]
KAAEKERATALKAEKERADKEKAERERAEREKAEREKADKEQAAREAKENADQAAQAKKAATMKEAKIPATAKLSKALSPAAVTLSEPATQVPILSRMPKKSKPIAKPIRIPKEEPIADTTSSLTSAATSDAPQFPDTLTQESSSNNSRAGSLDRTVPNQPTPLETLVAEINVQLPWMEISKHPFFDLQKINPAAKMPLEYGPLVHALSALSVGGGSFANNMPSGSIDNAVSSFQQLLETLTQTISDLLRLLPRKTWDDNSSFDGVLRDMLKGDDFLDDGGDD